jgi:diguanylate cyclase (GGDEF)-like protein
MTVRRRRRGSEPTSAGDGGAPRAAGPPIGDSDPTPGADSPLREFSRDIHRRVAREREQSARDRLRAADERDAFADARDLAAEDRDRVADARDRAVAGVDAAREADDAALSDGAGDGWRPVLTQAALQRSWAARDRLAAAQDRAAAATERLRARADREALTRLIALAETDPLTGARTRTAGLADLDHELSRCARESAGLVVAYVQVGGLASVNDSAGRRAGDELLTRVAGLIKAHLRPYDLVIRLSGSTFLCAMPNMSTSEAHGRFREVAVAVAIAPDDGTITTGVAELAGDQSAVQLIAAARASCAPD